MCHACAANPLFIMKTTVLTCVISAALGCAAAAERGDEAFRIEQTQFVESVWNEGHAQASIVSQDGGFSYAVPGGSLWWFGDTFKGSRDENGKPHFAGGAVSCDVAFLKEADKRISPVLQYLTGADGTVAQAIPFLADESWDHHRIWPLGGIYLNGKSYVYYTLIEIGEGTWDFQGVGSGLACATKPLDVYQRIQTDQGWRFPVAAVSVLTAGDWVYLYEVEKRADEHGLWLARVRPEEIEDPNAYQFYCGPGPAFSPDKDKQALLLKDIYGQTSVVWNEYLRQYVLASSSSFFRPREIHFYTADQPFGPWTETPTFVTAPESLQDKKVELVYCAYFHPELFGNEGQVMNLTFSLHLEDSGFDANNGLVNVEIQKSPGQTQ